MNAFSASFGTEADKFLGQLNACKVVDRINAGHAFYTRVSVDRLRCHELPSCDKGGTFAADGISHGIGILLWVDDGYLATISGWTYGGNPLLGRSLAELKFLGTAQLG